MRLLPTIRLGTEHYPENVARRLRTVNITAWIASATSTSFAFAHLLAPAPGLWKAGVINALMASIFAALPLLHRLGPRAGALALVLLTYADLFLLVCLLGTGTGMQLYYLVGAALTVLFFGTEFIVLAVIFGCVAAALIIILQLLVPSDTGLLPTPMIVESFIVSTVVSCGTLLLIVFYAMREAARAETTAEHEYERSEKLLTNILPLPVSARLKAEGHGVIADRYDEASVLFADMAGFTERASDTAPEDLVQFLNRVYSALDQLVERHGLEKIKTTGDAYMVVSGVPVARPDHAKALADLALEMREVAAEWRDARGRTVPVRIGIGSGPVVAGVVGTRKFFYDVWGDAVNVASRMETTGSPGNIQVSQETYERLKNDFVLEARGEIEVKGKGKIPTWFLLARKPVAMLPLPPHADEPIVAVT